MKDRIILPILFILITTLFFYPMFTEGKLPIPADTIVSLYHPYRDLNLVNGAAYKNSLITDPVRQQYPWRELSTSVQKENNLPLWNPYTFSGTPLLANFQTAAFYPFNLLFFIFPFEIAWSILIYFQPLFAGLFMFLYLKNLRLSMSASFLGSIAYAFSGFMTAWVEWGTIGHTALWLPIVLLSVDKILSFSKQTKVKNKAQKQSKIEHSKIFMNKSILLWGCVFVISLASSFFAGHLQTFVYIFVLSLSYLLVRWIQSGKFSIQLYIFIPLYLLFAVVTFVQWFPTANFILESGRQVDQINNWLKPGWFIPWEHLIQFIAPDFFGNPSTLNYWGVWNYGEFVGYVGLFPLIMAFYAMYQRKDKISLFFIILFFVSLIFSLPNIIAKLPYIIQIPFFSSTQPTRLLFIADFCLAVLAAMGFDTYIKSKEKKKILYSLGLVILIVGILWGFVLFGSLLNIVSIENLSIAKRNLLLPSALLFCITALMVILAYRHKVKMRYITHALIVCLLLVTIFDLHRFFQKYNTFTESTLLFPQTKILTFLQEQQGEFRIMATSSELLPPNFSTVYRIQTIEGYDPLYLLRYGEFMAALRRNEPDIKAPFNFNRIITAHNIKSPLVDLVGAKYILSLSPVKEKGFEKKITEGKTILYENKEAFPRVFFTENIISTQTKEASIKMLYDRKVNLRKTAIVEGWDKATLNFGSGSASIVEYKENQVVIKTSNDKEGYLVLMDTFYPAWHAQICESDKNNCQETKIYLTNYTFRGITVPAGEHTIRFYVSFL